MDLVRRWLPQKKTASANSVPEAQSFGESGIYLLLLKDRLVADLSLLREEKGHPSEKLIRGMQLFTGCFAEVRAFEAKKQIPLPDYLFLELPGQTGLLLEAHLVVTEKFVLSAATRVIPQMLASEARLEKNPELFVTQPGTLEVFQRISRDMVRTAEGRTLDIDQVSEWLLACACERSVTQEIS